MSDRPVRGQDVYLTAKMGVLIQSFLASGLLTEADVEAINRSTGQVQMALTWLGNALADAQRVAAQDPLNSPEAWLHDARSSLMALSGALDMLKQTGIVEGLGLEKLRDLGWLETLLEKQAGETRVLEQIVKISG